MSRRRRRLVIAACVTAGAFVVWLDHNRPRSRQTAGTADEQLARTADARSYHGKVFHVVKIVDGDTIDIDAPDGRFEYTRIRLWGIDAPESKRPGAAVMYYGPEAAEFTEKLALGHDVRVYLDVGNRTRGYYGRLLAYVQLPDKRFLNEVLLTEGYAYADLRFDHGLYSKYKQLEAAARAQKRGLWRHVKREDLPEWLQKKRPGLARGE